MFFFNVLPWAVISGGFIIWALAGCCQCPYLKSYFQHAQWQWLMLWLINKTRVTGNPAGVKRSGGTTYLCVPSCLSFSKGSNRPTGDVSPVSTVKDQSGHNYSLPEIYDALPRDGFCVNGAAQVLHRTCVDLDCFWRESMLTCATPRRAAIIVKKRWISVTAHPFEHSGPRLFRWLDCSAILIWSSIPRQLSAAIVRSSEEECSRRGYCIDDIFHTNVTFSCLMTEIFSCSLTFAEYQFD